jgi:hypothetical protein
MRREPHIGTVDEYQFYFIQHKLEHYEEAMLLAHARAGDLTMGAIARAAGWSSFRSGNRWYGALAQKIRTTLGLPFAATNTERHYHVLSLCAEAGNNENGEIVLRIHQEVVDGVRNAGILT